MAYVNYQEIGKSVFITGIGGLIGSYVHMQFLAPRFAGQMIMGIPTLSIIDLVAAFGVGILTTLYGRGNAMAMIIGYGVTATLAGNALLNIIQTFTGGVVPLARSTPRLRTPAATGIASVPRASYLAPPGVIVNKHGTVPEVAAGTFA